MSVAAIVVAAGSGTRFGGTLPKQFISLKGKEIFIRSVETFHRSSCIDRVILVINQKWKVFAKEQLKKHHLEKIEIISGGKSRQRSVYKGLDLLNENPPEQVLIHDAVRPLFPEAYINTILKKIKPGYGAVFAKAVKDTLYIVENSKVIDSPPRERFWFAETPQGFVYSEILKAHKLGLKEEQNATDEVQLYTKYIGEVNIIPSTFPNPKITTKDDVRFAESFLDS